jgi:hypothetical protein
MIIYTFNTRALIANQDLAFLSLQFSFNEPSFRVRKIRKFKKSLTNDPWQEIFLEYQMDYKLPNNIRKKST